MIKKYNNISLAVGVPGLMLQLYGTFEKVSILSILGMIILALIPDKSSDQSTKSIGLFTKIFLGLFLAMLIAVIVIPMFAVG